MKGDKHGKVTIETGIFRKEAAADMYMLESSAHPLTLKRGMIKGECMRYRTRCTRRERFERAWTRFDKALRGRGYSKEEVAGAREGIQWEDRPETMRRMDKKAEDRKRERKSGRGQRKDCVQIIIPDKGGVDNWWRECRTKGAPKEMGGLTTEITDRLPAGVKLGRKTTANLGKSMKKSARAPGQKVHARTHARTHSHPCTHTLTPTHTHTQLARVCTIKRLTLTWRTWQSREREKQRQT